jgi:hypothetical protein
MAPTIFFTNSLDFFRKNFKYGNEYVSYLKHTENKIVISALDEWCNTERIARTIMSLFLLLVGILVGAFEWYLTQNYIFSLLGLVCPVVVPFLMKKKMNFTTPQEKEVHNHYTSFVTMYEKLKNDEEKAFFDKVYNTLRK